MPDNENLTYSYQKRTLDHRPERSLLTPERAQKLDLLVHLLSNLRQALVVCGPPGIGKTTLLEALQQSQREQWQISLLKATPASSFETIVHELLRSLNIPNLAASFDLTRLRELCGKQAVVLLIDDAGHLMPGLITMLIEFADSLPGLHLVFALSHDQFSIKAGTDRRIEDAHVIELPPLKQRHYRDFLQNLSAQPGSAISFNAVTDPLIEALYLETHGIPGRILEELPKLAEQQGRTGARRGLWLGVIAVIAGTGGAMVWLWPNNDEKTLIAAPSLGKPTSQVLPAEPVNPSAQAPAETPAPASKPLDGPAPTAQVDERPADAAKPVPPPAPQSTPQPFPITQQTTKAAPAENEPNAVQTASAPVPAQPASDAAPSLPAPIAATTAATPPVAPPTPAVTPTVPSKTESATPPVVAGKPPEKPAKPAKPSDQGDSDWIAAQPGTHYTLQVMTLSNKAGLPRFFKKYAEYSESLKYYTIRQGDQEKFVLIYGSFASPAEANQFKTLMPGEFQTAQPIRFKAIQKDGKR
ncbi:AAA family ATPase [Methylomonas sp. UP202]|uniref:AAA family ATPase n=1 Tax=Methylomonas sp. UP202 TaxID=3040943 RepID=UPI002478E01E|nr:AAA family ATPase [Methylomonas sp. UP202]WGS86784.1 AAA family ATPase [Methylomonas sp. UP202]